MWDRPTSFTYLEAKNNKTPHYSHFKHSLSCHFGDHSFPLNPKILPMEGDETILPSLTQNNISPTYDHHLFTPSSSSFDPSFPYTCPLLPLPPLQNNPSPFDNLDIDWISLLSGKPLSPNLTAGDNYEGDQGINGGGKLHKGKNNGSRMSKRSAVPSRIAFHTRSSEDILDDGFKWRKYGQKSVKNSKHPRSYYRCTHHTCNVKKQIQRLTKDNGVVVTTYEGIHNHPCEKLMETLTPLLKQLQFLSRF